VQTRPFSPPSLQNNALMSSVARVSSVIGASAGRQAVSRRSALPGAAPRAWMRRQPQGLPRSACAASAKVRELSAEFRAEKAAGRETYAPETFDELVNGERNSPQGPPSTKGPPPLRDLPGDPPRRSHGRRPPQSPDNPSKSRPLPPADAVLAIEFAVQDGEKRIEVEFPAVNIDGYKGASDLYIDSNLQLAISAARKLHERDGKKVHVVLSDAGELKRSYK